MPRDNMLDALDRNILNSLRQNGRQTVAKLARCLGKPEGTIRSRMDVLKKCGVIERFTILISENRSKFSFFCYIILELHSNNAEHEEVIRDIVRTNKNVLFCDDISGGYDFIMYIGCYQEQCLATIRNKLASLEIVKSTMVLTRTGSVKEYEIAIDDII